MNFSVTFLLAIVAFILAVASIYSQGRLPLWISVVFIAIVLMVMSLGIR
jgi:hypothetical protein